MKVYIIKKIVKAKDLREALKLEKKAKVEEIMLDEDSYKKIIFEKSKEK